MLIRGAGCTGVGSGARGAAGDTGVRALGWGDTGRGPALGPATAAAVPQALPRVVPAQAASFHLPSS